jgi:hypothetical protein
VTLASSESATSRKVSPIAVARVTNGGPIRIELATRDAGDPEESHPAGAARWKNDDMPPRADKEMTQRTGGGTRVPWSKRMRNTDVHRPGGMAVTASEHEPLWAIGSALACLPGEQREVILLVGPEGMSYETAAQVLSVPVGTVRSRLSRGRDALRRLMDIPERGAGATAQASRALAA